MAQFLLLKSALGSHGTFLHLPTVCPHPLLSTRRINQISLRIVETKPGKPTICWDRRYLPTISFLSPLRESYFLWWRPPTLPLTMTMWCFLEVDSLDWNDYFFCYQQIHRYHRSTIIFWPQNFPYNLKKLLAILFCLGLLWSSGKGQARIVKGWQSRQKALKPKPLPRAYTKVGCHHHHPKFNFT